MSETTKRYCEYELPDKPFACCKRVATVEIERNGHFCRQHAAKVIDALQRAGISRPVRKLKEGRRP